MSLYVESNAAHWHVMRPGPEIVAVAGLALLSLDGRVRGVARRLGLTLLPR